MKFVRYKNADDFNNDVLPVLYKDEVLNNLFINVVTCNTPVSSDNCFMGTVVDDTGRYVLIALCTKPFNLMLYMPPADTDDDLIRTQVLTRIIEELRDTGFYPSGVFAPSQLAHAFSVMYCGNQNDGKTTAVKEKRTMLLMMLHDASQLPPPDRTEIQGLYRVLREEEIDLIAIWERDFSIECRLPVFSLDEYKSRLRARLMRDSHYILEVNGIPVSQAVFGRETKNCAVISWVYTPPEFRSRGYARAVTARLSETLLKQNKSYCCLFADADNKTSCGIYSALGYKTVAAFEEITFHQ